MQSQDQQQSSNYKLMFGTVYVSDVGEGVPEFDSASIRVVAMQGSIMIPRHKHGSSACIDLRIVNDAGESLFTQHFDNPLRTDREVFGDTIRLEPIALSHASLTFRCPLPEGSQAVEFWYSRGDSLSFLLGKEDL